MKARTTILAAVFPLLLSHAHAITNLLINPSFEEWTSGSPPLSGNNISASVPGWTLSSGLHNLVYPDPSYAGGPTQAQSGDFYYDYDAPDAYLYQNFTLSDQANDITFGAWFSRRDDDDGQGQVEIWDLGTNQLIAWTSVVDVPVGSDVAGQKIWVETTTSGDSPSLTSLAPGTYQFRILMTNPTNVDSAYFNANVVPEPTGALAGLLLGSVLLRRKRQ